MDRFYDVDVYCHEDDEGGNPWWGGEGGLAGDSTGVFFESTQELRSFVDDVHDEVSRFRRRWPELSVRWRDGRLPATGFFIAARESGISLP